MQVILLENIRNLGGFGKTVKVSKGFARNYLVPQGKAVYATKDNLDSFESRRQEYEAMAADKLAQAKTRGEQLGQIGELTIEANASEEGKLYGSIGTVELAHAIVEKGVEVSRGEILLPHGALRQVGQFNITVALHPEVEIEVVVNIEAAKENA